MKQGKVAHYTEIEALPFGAAAPKAAVRWLIDDDHDNAPTFSLRMIEIETGGSSPNHAHPYEHENFIVEGVGKVLIGETWYDLKQGDIAYVPENIQHQYVNTGDTTFKFLCAIPVKEIQIQRNNC